MRNFFLAPMCGLLLVVAACGSDSSDPGDPGGGEIRSQADVQRFFEAIVPDLIEAFTELAGQLAPPAFSSSADKGGSMSSTIECPGPGGGTLSLDLVTFETTLSACSVGGVTISATLFLSVTDFGMNDFGMSMYSAEFSGPLMVSGSFTGTVMIEYAFISWTAPATVDNTFWQVQGTVNDQQFAASSDGGGGGGCPEIDLNDFSGERDAACDDDSDCKSTCRVSNDDPLEACTCRPPDDGGGQCDLCIGVDIAGPGEPSNTATVCEAVGPFECSCATQSGLTTFFYLEGGACFY